MDRKRPFWLPASNYYVMAGAICAAVFFLMWGVLHDSGDEMPWITAGVASSIMMAAAVIVREFVMRRTGLRLVQPQDAHVSNRLRSRDSIPSGKLTIEDNAAILREIRQKSDAANVLSRFSAGHREVFELCGEYISRNEEELKTMSPGSPRLVPLLRGRTAATDLHRSHLLKWAEIEARNLTAEARSHVQTPEKVRATQNALEVIESALSAYPNEKPLLESRAVLEDFIVSIRISVLMEAAERSAFDGHYTQAIGHYREALFELGRGNVDGPARANAAERINIEIEKLRAMETTTGLERPMA